MAQVAGTGSTTDTQGAQGFPTSFTAASNDLNSVGSEGNANAPSQLASGTDAANVSAADINGAAGLNVLTNAQLAGLYQNPDTGTSATAGVDANGNPIVIPGTGLFGEISNLQTPLTASQAQSPLAGLTTLGSVANAGTTAAGLSTAGQVGVGPVAQTGVTNTGVTNAGGVGLGNAAQQGVVNAGNTTINTGQSNALLGGQVANINQLGQEAAGNGPSPAALQAQQTTQQNIANQMAAMSSQRGASNSALGLRSAMNATAAANQTGVQAAVQAKAAEQLAAQNQLTSALSGTQGQVMQGAQAQGTLDQNIALANAASGNAAAAGNTSAQNAILNAQGQLSQGTNLANAAANTAAQGQNATAANTIGTANTAAQNAAQSQTAQQAQATTLANAQAGNTLNLANSGAINAAELQNAQAQNALTSQQGTMAQGLSQSNAALDATQTLANQQAQQLTQANNINEQNTALQAGMTLSSNNQTAAENYANALLQQNENAHAEQLNANTNIAINGTNNTMGLIGAGIGAVGALGAAAAKASDRNLKTNIKSGNRSIKNFLNQISISTTKSNFKLMGE